MLVFQTLPTAAQADSTAFQPVVDRVAAILRLLGAEPEAAVSKLLSAVAILGLAWVVWRVARRITATYENHLVGQMDETLEHSAQRARTVVQLVNSVLTVAIVATMVLLLLNLVIPIAPLLAGVGVFGLAVSFGAQSLVKDIISGFFILAENQFAVGDVVRIGETAGAVERITLRVVMLRDIEGILHIIPNGTINTVSNLTRGWSRVVIDVSVAYKENADEVMRTLGSIVNQCYADPAWKARFMEPPKVLGVQALGESSVDIRVLANTYPGKQWDVKRELLRRIKGRFDELGIEIPFPQRTLHLRPDGISPALGEPPGTT